MTRANISGRFSMTSRPQKQMTAVSGSVTPSLATRNEVEGRAVRHSHVDDAGAKVFDLLFDFGRQGKSNLVSVLEGNGDGVVHK
mmetsp:Transcript_6045/g.9180  ORF Transcript_6045/g.9180 Transcript_6045/m.9180 type:complete len:84 (-) Transcript_6045:146-397(-)